MSWAGAMVLEILLDSLQISLKTDLWSDTSNSYSSTILVKNVSSGVLSGVFVLFCATLMLKKISSHCRKSPLVLGSTVRSSWTPGRPDGHGGETFNNVRICIHSITSLFLKSNKIMGVKKQISVWLYVSIQHKCTDPQRWMKLTAVLKPHHYWGKFNGCYNGNVINTKFLSYIRIYLLFVCFVFFQ